MSRHYQVRINDDSNSDDWWTSLDEHLPHLAKRLRKNSSRGDGLTRVSAVEYRLLRALPDWDDEPLIRVARRTSR